MSAPPPPPASAAPTGPPTPTLPQAVALELVAFSLPAARGAWGGFGIGCALLGLVAATLRRPRLGELRVALALLGAFAAAHPLLSALQLLVAAAWYRPGRWKLVAAAVAAGLLTPGFENLPLPKVPLRDAPGVITVAQWNIGRRREEGWEFLTLPHFRSVKLDLYVLFENGWDEHRPGFDHWKPLRAADEAATLRLAEELGLSHRYVDPPMGFREKPYQSGVVVLSRHPLTLLPGGDPRAPRALPPAFWVHHPDGAFVLAPFHLWSPPHADLAERRAALEAVLLRLPSDAPRVLGDTNMAPLDRHDLPGRHGYAETALVSQYYAGTWPSRLPLVRLDTSFVAGGLEPVRYQVLGAKASDHRPVVVQLRRAPLEQVGEGEGSAPAAATSTGAAAPAEAAAPEAGDSAR